MNTNRDFITKEQFENYLKDVCGNTHANIAEKYNINSIKGVISSINPDYKKYIDVIKQNNDMFINLAHEDHFSFIEMITYLRNAPYICNGCYTCNCKYHEKKSEHILSKTKYMRERKFKEINGSIFLKAIASLLYLFFICFQLSSCTWIISALGT